MQIFENIAELRAHLAGIRRQNLCIGLVPTMGNLHAGHLALVKEARRQCDHVVTTIFVNPLQFGPGEDYHRYPRSLEDDKQQLQAEDCDTLFAPPVEEVYPEGLENETVVSVPGISERYCGRSRPGHFDGVATVVCKLFNMILPDAAFFGRKDYQQLLVIRKMVQDLCMPVAVLDVPTQRESGGLAMSSRNRYLSNEERKRAANLYATLLAVKARIEGGERDFSTLEEQAKTRLDRHGITVDYFNICHAHTLDPPEPDDRELVILGAVYIGGARLIDNVTISR